MRKMYYFFLLASLLIVASSSAFAQKYCLEYTAGGLEMQHWGPAPSWEDCRKQVDKIMNQLSNLRLLPLIYTIRKQSECTYCGGGTPEGVNVRTGSSESRRSASSGNIGTPSIRVSRPSGRGSGSSSSSPSSSYTYRPDLATSLKIGAAEGLASGIKEAYSPENMERARQMNEIGRLNGEAMERRLDNAEEEIDRQLSEVDSKLKPLRGGLNRRFQNVAPAPVTVRNELTVTDKLAEWSESENNGKIEGSVPFGIGANMSAAKTAETDLERAAAAQGKYNPDALEQDYTKVTPTTPLNDVQLLDFKNRFPDMAQKIYAIPRKKILMDGRFAEKESEIKEYYRQEQQKAVYEEDWEKLKSLSEQQKEDLDNLNRLNKAWKRVSDSYTPVEGEMDNIDRLHNRQTDMIWDDLNSGICPQCTDEQNKEAKQATIEYEKMKNLFND